MKPWTPGCGNCCPSTLVDLCLFVWGCSGNGRVAGASVTLYRLVASTWVLVGTDTTDALGEVCFAVPSANATFRADVTAAGYAFKSVQFFGGPGFARIDLTPASGFHCCANCGSAPIPAGFDYSGTLGGGTLASSARFPFPSYEAQNTFQALGWPLPQNCPTLQACADAGAATPYAMRTIITSTRVLMVDKCLGTLHRFWKVGSCDCRLGGFFGSVRAWDGSGSLQTGLNINNGWDSAAPLSRTCEPLTATFRLPRVEVGPSSFVPEEIVTLVANA